jgi:D-glycero-alpha-D-manno-heptose-7-phosphate kinase
LNECFLLFFTGVSRRADTILVEQKNNIKTRLTVLREIKQMAYEARKDLENGNFDAFGSLMHQAWETKKRLANQISNEALDEIYASARRAGAMGGKVTGAGGGGFILLYAPYERHRAVRAALSGLQELPFRLESDGTKTIFNYRRA